MRLLVVLVVAGCRREEPPAVTPGDGSPLVVVDARSIAVQPIDAPARPACNVQPFSFGAFDVPAGWCWRRTAEGDDLSGELDDDKDIARMTYQLFAHGARVDDVCRRRPERVSERTETIKGVRVHACVLANGHHCYAFPKTNACTTDVSFDADALVRTLHAK